MDQRALGAWRFPLVLAVLAAGSAGAFPLPWRRGRSPAPSAAAAAPRASVAIGDAAVRTGALANGLSWAIEPIAGAPVSLRLGLSGRAVEGEPDAAAMAAVLRRLAVDEMKPPHHGDPRAFAAAHGLTLTPDETARPWSLAGATYRFDAVTADPASVEAALALLRGAAGGLALEPKAIDRARDALAAEARGPGAAGRRVYLARAAFLLGADPAAASLEPPARIRRSELAAFHDQAYRPESAVLTIAGDVDPAATERDIARLFGDWRGRAGPPPAPPARRGGVEARLVSDPAAPPSLQLTWLAAPTGGRPVDRGPALARALAIDVINQRLAREGPSEAAPIGGAALLGEDGLGLEAVSLLAGVDADRWRAAVAALDGAQRRAAAQPIGAAELAEAIAGERARLTERAGAAATAAAIADDADALAADLAAGSAPTSAAGDLAAFEADLGAATPEAVRRAAADLFAGAGPLIFLTAPAPVAGGEAAIVSAYLEAHAAPLAPPTRSRPLAWPYGDFGQPGVIASQREVADLGAVFATFENGVRLIVKPTKFAPGEARVAVLAGSGVPPTLDGPAVIRGGLKKIAWSDIAATLGGARFSADLAARDGAAAFTGVTTSDDLEAQMRVLTAYLLDPARPPPAAAGETAGPICAVIVGDVTPEKAIAAASRTLGALPAVAGRASPPPEAVPSPAEALLAEIARAGGEARAPSAAALETARAALLARLDRDQRSNGWWLDALAYVDADPARLARLRSLRAGLLRVNLADLRAAARR